MSICWAGVWKRVKKEEEERDEYRQTGSCHQSKGIRSFLNPLTLQLCYSSSSASIQPLHPHASLLSAGVSGGEGIEFPPFLLSDLGIMQSLDR